MPFKKKIELDELAEELVLLHAQMFNPGTLHEALNKSGVHLEGESAYNRAVVEWFHFGLFVLTQGVSAALRNDDELRDRIMNAFFKRFYAAMNRASVDAGDLPALEKDIQSCFSEYYCALADPAGLGPAGHLMQAVSMNVLGKKKFDASSYVFGLYAAGALAAGAETLREAIERYEVA